MVWNEQRNTPQRIAYSDESKHNTGRYRSLGLVSLKYTELKRIRNMIAGTIRESGVSELKWKKVRDERYRACAVEIINLLFPELCKEFARIDVLLWDTYDRRHTIIGRDDQQNLARMYFHLLKNVMNKRWNAIFTWHVHPDEQCLDWEAIMKTVNCATRPSKTYKDSLWLDMEPGLRERIRQMKPLVSKDEPMIQVADLFAGMAVYSWDAYRVYCSWKDRSTGQGNLFSCQPFEGAKSDGHRCMIISHLLGICQESRMSVSIGPDCGLKTHRPNNPMNFWMYEPRHEKDRAPVKTKRTQFHE